MDKFFVSAVGHDGLLREIFCQHCTAQIGVILHPKPLRCFTPKQRTDFPRTPDLQSSYASVEVVWSDKPLIKHRRRFQWNAVIGIGFLLFGILVLVLLKTSRIPAEEQVSTYFWQAVGLSFGSVFVYLTTIRINYIHIKMFHYLHNEIFNAQNEPCSCIGGPESELPEWQRDDTGEFEAPEPIHRCVGP